MHSPTIYWYDFETFGKDPRRDRVCQFAGIRTDEDLNVLGEPLVIYCKPSDDFLPNPFACLITGITPQKALAKGVDELEFTKRINEEFCVPQTCVVGYNSIKFDDEFMRRLLYRNLFDPYEREYKNGNSRWDIIDMVRLCGAVRPEGIVWPSTEKGEGSFKLDQLTLANNIEHKDAHDALADVLATIEIAKLIKASQPMLYDYVFKLKNKRRVEAAMNLGIQRPVLHVSTKYSSQRGYLGIILPICQHPNLSNRFIVYNLSEDPSRWTNLNLDEMREKINGMEKNPFGLISTNSCPIVATPKILTKSINEKYDLNIDSCLDRVRLLQGNQALAQKISELYAEQKMKTDLDPDLMIYEGFFNERDKRLMETARETKPEDLGRLDLPFQDQRLHELFFRYRARNFRHTLTNQEVIRWNKFRGHKFERENVFGQFEKNLKEACNHVEKNDIAFGESVLSELKDYADNVKASLMP